MWTDGEQFWVGGFNGESVGGASTPVKIYSNLDTVELFVNGTSQGSMTAPDHGFIWPNVPLNSGQNTIEAHATTGGNAVTDTVVWTRM